MVPKRRKDPIYFRFTCNSTIMHWYKLVTHYLLPRLLIKTKSATFYNAYGMFHFYITSVCCSAVKPSHNSIMIINHVISGYNILWTFYAVIEVHAICEHPLFRIFRFINIALFVYRHIILSWYLDCSFFLYVLTALQYNYIILYMCTLFYNILNPFESISQHTYREELSFRKNNIPLLLTVYTWSEAGN